MMLRLVDTSVWIDHFSGRDPGLQQRLDDPAIRLHEFVLGELLMGAIPRGHRLASAMAALPRVATLSHEEVVRFIELHRLRGSGIGWLDVHLLASAKGNGAELWTRDVQLLRAAARSQVVAFSP